MNSILHGQRLLVLPDRHRALLAEYDYFLHYDLLHVRWHGHLTAAALVEGTQAGMALFSGRPLPRRLLSDNSQTSGEWEDAIPWLHYEWLPQASSQGLQLLAHVLQPDSEAPLEKAAGGADFWEVLSSRLRVRSFRGQAAAWQWATTR